MKDAKGHGSNPRGAHAEGVDQVGQYEGVRQKAMRGIQAWRGVSERGSHDPGDFGQGTYYSTSGHTAQQYGNPAIQTELKFSNPLVLDVHSAYDLAERYGTVNGTPESRTAAAARLSADLRSAGHDGFISVDHKRSGKTDLEIVDMRGRK